MLLSLEGRMPDLEGRLRMLTTPNTEDGRFSGKKFQVGMVSSLESALSSLRHDLIVIKVSGKLLLDEKEPGETLSRREYLVQTMALLSQLGLNIFLIHGGQEQLDRAIEEDTDLSPGDRRLAMLKNGAVRYTPPSVLQVVISTSNSLSDGPKQAGLKQAIIKAGGNANAYLSSLFIGNKMPRFTNPETGEAYSDNCFGYLPLDGRLRVVHDREARVLRYLRGEIDTQGAAPGHIMVRGFLVNSDSPDEKLGQKRKVNPKTGEKEDPYRLNGDADNVAAAHAFYFSRREVVPVKSNGHATLVLPARVHLLEIARNGGLRAGPGKYDSIVDIVTSEQTLERQEIEGGMEGKVRTSLNVARALNNGNVPAMVKIIHMRELLPCLFGNEVAVRSGFGSGYGTTFAPDGLEMLESRFYRS